ncbi:Undecaprenyl-phosphate alpha-N-acetylglucosaminyl 1-phosphate transferase [Pseudomonas chlororaphis subsp. aureofaciens]|uniref:MraY family glycosyltransferase n=1 Tax=Pseudomonas TaxID=286 RepID=UPI0004AC02AA|nr:MULTISPECIES: glycosyltransferase family 4 protein [Pseudomonas]AIC21449.1 glycosyl transferase [Pseudomonas chlororaphis]AZE43897.1 Undecaprenyl-phosphate alpha-N-acetylglucosaminyl 1-phosphate transferase [Pseudomonas chlororaphis subsp. aureofaciens]PWY48417.1 glycosyl transferase [Pseudomonas sp. RW409]QHC90955.1 glycosyl transferase [Pseudomonas chlororaphis]
MIVWWLLVAVFIVSWGMTFILRRYALAKSLMDIPNERSSHSIPTPRGGGVAIVASFTLALPALYCFGLLDPGLFYGLLGAGLLVAIIGFADDHGHIAARWRLLGHFFAAVWTLYWMGGLAPVSMFGMEVKLGWLGSVLATIYLVWMLNLYNFMDGIDGIASVQAIFVCLASCFISLLAGSGSVLWVSFLLSGAVAGFLLWNFPPARIFMGDAGSGFLGVVLGGLSLYAAWGGSELMWSWLILLAIFTVDSTVTLLRRLVRGEKIYQAHRSHAYQYAARHYASHKIVTLGVTCINVLWVFPMAVLVGIGCLDGLTGLIATYVPLIFLAFRFTAGKREAQI